MSMDPKLEEVIRTHPCYCEDAHRSFARMHLPVAPRCNIQCNFCNRRFDCCNESRPGVTSEVLTPEEKREWLSKLIDVSLGSDAFFPFPDNIERARRSGVRYVAQPGGSIRDDLVIAKCDDYDMVMAFTGMRLFHH